MNKNFTILAIETSQRLGSVSILSGEQQTAFKIGNREVSRSEDLLQMISEVLRESRLESKDIDLIAVSNGPGSLTGVRVGVATAKALAFGLKINCLGVSVLEALSLSVSTAERVLTAVPSGRDQVFWESFEFGEVGKNNSFKPKVEKLAEFMEKTWNFNWDSLAIVFEAELYKQASISFPEILEKREIICASDNVAKMIGQIGTKMFREMKVKNTEVLPQYVREVEIGKGKEI
jgi:tRNA threonylcarbamoyl adenosine modification protein YeaZ